MTFRVTEEKTALGIVHKFHGPGMPQYANGVHVLQRLNCWALECLLKDDQRPTHEADVVLRLLEAAFEAGKQQAKREIREMLGIYK